MPKTEIDYSNTIIYKITCKDDAIKDLYVGHTTNFVQRKHAHKQSCINVKSANYKCKLYEVLRANGGWNNWNMETIDFFNCKNLFEARQKEQEYFISLKATLNSIEPMPRPKNIVSPKADKHIKNNTQLKDSIQLEENTLKCMKFSCLDCKYNTSRNSQFNRHLTTSKHINNLKNKNCIIENQKKFICNKCSKIYTDRSGLWKHSKTCNKEHTTTKESLKDDVTNLSALVMELMKNNIELTKKMTDVCNILINNTTPVVV
jgi:hypothetical protein